jgi:hypothetical protein
METHCLAVCPVTAVARKRRCARRGEWQVPECLAGCPAACALVTVAAGRCAFIGTLSGELRPLQLRAQAQVVAAHYNTRPQLREHSWEQS